MEGGKRKTEERQAQAPPGAEHRPAVAVADVVRKTVQVARITGELEVDAGDAGAQGYDAESS